MIEEWKIIEDFKGYSISNYGNVKSNKTNKILKQSHNKQKYSYVWIKRNDNEWKHIRVHRLVAEAFIPNPLNKPCVNHLDYDTANNKANNLEWVSYKENSEYSMEHLKARPYNYKHSEERKHKISINRTNFKNELGHHIYKQRKKYVFKFMTNGNKISKSFDSLEEATKYRDDYLDTIGYYKVLKGMIS